MRRRGEQSAGVSQLDSAVMQASVGQYCITCSQRTGMQRSWKAAAGFGGTLRPILSHKQEISAWWELEETHHAAILHVPVQNILKKLRINGTFEVNIAAAKL